MSLPRILVLLSPVRVPRKYFSEVQQIYKKNKNRFDLTIKKAFIV